MNPPNESSRLDELAATLASATTRREALLRGAGMLGGILAGVLGFGTRKAQGFPAAYCLSLCSVYTNLLQRQRCIATCQGCTTVMCNGACCPAGSTCVNGTCAAVCTVGGACFSYRPCPSSPGNFNCACGSTAEGGVFCFQSSSCPGESNCARSSDCPAGQFCLVNSCCGFPICAGPCNNGRNAAAIPNRGPSSTRRGP